MGADMENSISIFDGFSIDSTPRSGEHLGQGTFGTVYKVFNNGKPYAVKRFHDTNLNMETLLRELKCYKDISHENVVKCYGMRLANGHYEMIFEYLADGNLLEYARKSLKKTRGFKICSDICKGMEYLHFKNILHKDLAARNILIHGNLAKICDLGMSIVLTKNNSGEYAITNGRPVPFRHYPKEALEQHVYTPASDVWSFGVLLYEVYSNGKLPYENMRHQEVTQLVLAGGNPLTVGDVTSKYIKTIMNTIFVEDFLRPDFADLHKKFTNILKKLDNKRSSRPERTQPLSQTALFTPLPVAPGNIYDESGSGAEPKQSLPQVSLDLGESCRCSICHSGISGTRYKCLYCESYNLCPSCERSGHHMNHIMVRISNPEAKHPVYSLTQASRIIIPDEEYLKTLEGLEPMLHPGVVCDVCTSPVFGIRYKDLTSNYDLCSTCMEHHSHQLMIRISYPQQMQEGIVKCLMVFYEVYS